MIYTLELKLAADRNYTIDDLKAAAASRIGVKVNTLTGVFEIAKKSLDSRKKSNIQWVYAVKVELSKPPNSVYATRLTPLQSHKNEREIPLQHTTGGKLQFSPQRSQDPAVHRPIVVGAGPAGLFAALTLAKAGRAPLVLERGKPMAERVRDVELFWRGGALSTSSNVQFGEGGAGTFSDGKLTTGIRDPRCRDVLEAFVKAGAPSEILYLQKPHIGTDRLRAVVTTLRKQIETLGGEFMFGTTLVGINANLDVLKSVEIEQNGAKSQLPCRHMVLAIGHSARDTFDMLQRSGVRIEPKPFAVGLRIEHLQSDIDMAQYGRERGEFLPPADYKLSARSGKNLGVFTFCMCPGGQVVAAASEEGGVVTNGMSRHARDGKNANSALLVGVTPDVFGSAPLDGVRYQRDLERAAFEAAGRSYRAPAQYSCDFLGVHGRREVRPTYQPGVVETSLEAVLPLPIVEALREVVPLFDRKLRGFSDGLLTGVESRSSSPVRILRDERCSSNIDGLVPCGEGAGYAGGIMSAAVDGIRCAESLIG